MQPNEDTYTPGQAARALKVTDRQVRHMLDAGELEGHKADNGRWRIPKHDVHRLIEERRRQAALNAPLEALGGSQEAAELRLRVEDLQYQLGRLEGRLELTERAESTMQQERERLIADLERERERAERLEAELEQARRDAARPWWRRMFGGG